MYSFLFNKQPILYFLMVQAALLTAVSCTPKSGRQKLASKDTTNVAVNPHLYFINFKITKDTVEKLDARIVNGSLKKNSVVSPTSPPFLHYRLLNQNKEVISEASILHPLYKHAEYMDDNKQMQSREWIVPEETFFIRVDYVPMIKYIDFSEQLKDTSRHLALIKLQ